MTLKSFVEVRNHSVVALTLNFLCILMYSNKMSMEFVEGSRGIYRPIRVTERVFRVHTFLCDGVISLNDKLMNII